MRWTRTVGLAAGIAALAGCGYLYEVRGTVASYDVSGRPVAGYYCYDCHGYRYFDPYYDWCPGHGFRYGWSRHPEAVGVYRARYVRIKQQNPDYGRYRYPSRYRDSRRYKEPHDYESWRSGQATSDRPGVRGPKVREKDAREPGSKGKKKEGRKGSEGREPEDRSRGPGDLRPVPPGGK